jgi:DNA replication protein DnaC
VSPSTADDLAAVCRIPPRYAHCLIDHFEPGTPSQRAALERVISFINGFPHHGPDEGLGLLFTGGNGVGKTHLAVAALQELALRKSVRGQYWDFHELIREIKNSYDAETSTTELSVLEPVVSTPLLLLDDLGAWRMTEWMNDTLFYLLNSRYLAKRPTIITTNFQDVDRETALAADAMRRKEYLVERIGQRLRSRLLEMCLMVPVDGHDWRSARQASNQVALRGTSRK